ncbi:MAG: hypothetical protein SF182_02575 [Deltaproteobacteria bacterium]|nr:hypothetical protein [Deltaproteobacteria bacterium]
MRLLRSTVLAYSLVTGVVAAPCAAQPDGAAGFVAQEGLCLGDCDGDRIVDVAELLRGVRIALGAAPRALCPVGGNGFWIDGLIGSVRNALIGCETVRDFSAFTTFSYRQVSALGFCPQPGSILSASLARAGAGAQLTITRVAAPPPGCDGDDPGCLREQPATCRQLNSEALAPVLDAFAAVTTYHTEDPVCLNTVYDPCVIRIAQWDGESFDDYPHNQRRLPDGEMSRLAALLDTLEGESAVPCGGVRAAVLDESRSTLVLQTAAIPIVLPLSAELTLTTRPPDRGDLSVLARLPDIHFAPIQVPGLVCACAQVRELSSNRPEALVGTIHCGAAAERELDLDTTVDHNTSPGSAGNRGGLPDDPECDNYIDHPAGTHSFACREGTGLACRSEHHLHTGVCNSPVVTTRDSVPAPRGSARLDLGVQLALLQDAGTCAEARRANGDCMFPDYGADCLPCTSDDPRERIDVEIALTTGRASASVYDLNNAGDPVQNEIAPDVDCFGVPCIASATGSPFDCDALAGNPSGGLGGAVLVGALPRVDEPQIGDTVMTFTLALRDAAPAPPP